MRFRRAYAFLLRRASLPALIAIQTAGLAVIGLGILAVKGPEWSFDAGVYREFAVQIFQGKVPYRDFTFEYPPFALAAMILPGLIAGTSPRAYGAALVLENVALMLATAVVVWRILKRESTDARSRRAVFLHGMLAGGLALVLLWRFDPFVALLSVLSLSAYGRNRPFAAGVWAGLGVAAKLVPVVVVAVLACDLLARRRAKDVVRLAVGWGLALACILGPAAMLAGAKLLDFVTYHSMRGIQIESVAGGFLLLAGRMSWTPILIEDTFGAFHVVSPWARALVAWMPPLSLILIAAALVRAWTLMRDAGGNLRVTAQMVFFVFLTFILSNKVLSPQYLIWLIPFAPFLRARQAALFVAICALTILIFPLTYKHLLAMRVPAVVLLNVRNLLMIGLATWLARGRTATRPSPVPAMAHSV